MKPTPTKFQQEILDCNFRVIRIGNDRGSGKTFGMLLKVADVCEKHENIRALFTSKSQFTLNTAAETLLGFGGWSLRATMFGKEASNGNGSSVLFRTCRNMKDCHKLAGCEFNVVAIDEAYEYENDEPEYLDCLVRAVNGPTMLLMTYTPVPQPIAKVLNNHRGEIISLVYGQ